MRACIGILCFLVMFFVGAHYFTLERTWLSLTVAREKEPVYVAYLPEKSRFCVRFKHSVALSPVEEWFVPHAGQVMLQSTVYEDFGAGLPHNAEAGQTMVVQDGKVIITGYNTLMPHFFLRVGRIAEHTIIIEKNDGTRTHVLALNSKVKPGTAIQVSILTRSLAEVLWNNWKHVAL